MQPHKGLNRENLLTSHLNQKLLRPLLPSHRTTWSPWTRSKRGERQKHEPALDPEVWRKQHYHQLWHWIQEQVWYASWNLKIILVLFFKFLASSQIFLYLTDTWDHMYTTRNISPTNNQANIVELHPACVYSIRMYSYNKIGRSLPSKELTISTEEARKLLFMSSNVTFECFFFFSCTLNNAFCDI